jgi:hypothetical protein
MIKILNQCPVCGGELVVTRQQCHQCDTVIEGHFPMPVAPFAQLSREQMQFLLSFIRCEGRFTRLEEELHLSYPTLRNRLTEVIAALGFEPAKEEPLSPRLSAEDRRRILEDLEQGTIDYLEAQRRLRGEQEPAAVAAE